MSKNPTIPTHFLMSASNEKELKLKTCAVCKSNAMKMCSACSLVSYCSQEHQKSHWKLHKQDCSPLLLKANEEFGRHFVAARSLLAGALILEEEPLAVGVLKPREAGIRGENLPPTEDKQYSCLGCCSSMITPDGVSNRCSKCKWPVCSVLCEKNPLHADNECKIFSKNGTIFGDHMLQMSEKILVLRTCLLKRKKDQNSWESVMNLQHDDASSRITDGVGNAMIYDLSRINDQLMLLKTEEELKLLNLEGLISSDDWMRVSAAVKFNAFKFKFPTNSFKPNYKASASFLLARASMFAHCCAPNCSFSMYLDSGSKVQMRVRTAVDIKKGDMLTIAYNQHPTVALLCTRVRQQEIPNFLCKCIRCKDPFEVGANSSTWMCQLCRGSVVSVNPLDPKANWKCSTPKCAFFTKTEGILSITPLQDLIESVEENEEGMKILQQFIEQNSPKYFHPNHFIIALAQQKIVVYLGSKHLGLSDNERDIYISTCQYLLAIADKVFPGLTRERAQLQNFIAKEMLTKAEKEWKAKRLGKLEYKSQLEKIMRLSRDSHKYFKNDFAEGVVGAMTIVAGIILNRIECVQNIYDTLKS